MSATNAADHRLLEAIRESNATLRAVLCAVARRGKALREGDPDRARALLEAARAHPLYKAARIAFDLLELEDLMLDGPPPEQVEGYLEAEAVSRIVRALGDIRTALVPVSREAGLPGPAGAGMDAAVRGIVAEAAPEGGWPSLDAADYLYDLVVLGVLRQGARLQAAALAAPSVGS
ncbi:hypothetical protein L6R50_13955 [Myxococcota bacterium]|nr:hypothetical protein [Myxococcota bacterium]